MNKLSLHRETLRALSADEARDVRGAYALPETGVDYSIFIRSCQCVNTVWCSEVATYCTELWTK